MRVVVVTIDKDTTNSPLYYARTNLNVGELVAASRRSRWDSIGQDTPLELLGSDLSALDLSRWYVGGSALRDCVWAERFSSGNVMLARKR